MIAPWNTTVPLASLIQTSCGTLASLLSKSRLNALPAGASTDACSKAIFRALIVTSAVAAGLAPLAAGLAPLAAGLAPLAAGLAPGVPLAPAEAGGSGVADGGGANVQPAVDDEAQPARARQASSALTAVRGLRARRISGTSSFRSASAAPARTTASGTHRGGSGCSRPLYRPVGGDASVQSTSGDRLSAMVPGRTDPKVLVPSSG